MDKLSVRTQPRGAKKWALIQSNLTTACVLVGLPNITRL